LANTTSSLPFSRYVRLETTETLLERGLHVGEGPI